MQFYPGNEWLRLCWLWPRYVDGRLRQPFRRPRHLALGQAHTCKKLLFWEFFRGIFLRSCWSWPQAPFSQNQAPGPWSIPDLQTIGKMDCFNFFCSLCEFFLTRSGCFLVACANFLDYSIWSWTVFLQMVRVTSKILSRKLWPLTTAVVVKIGQFILYFMRTQRKIKPSQLL